MDVRAVIRPFYLLSKLFGYTFFELSGVGEQTKESEVKSKLLRRLILQWSSILFIYPVIVCGNILLNANQIVFAGRFAADAFSTLTGKMLSSCVFMCTGVMFILSMCLSIYFRTDTRLILEKLKQFDGFFQKHFVAVNHVYHRWSVISYLFGSLVLPLVLVPTSIMMLDQTNVSWPFSVEFLVFSYWSALNYVVLQSHTVLSVAAVLVRFRAVNKELGAMLSTEHNHHLMCILQHESTIGGNVGRVQRLRILHDLLNDIVDLINLCFSFHAMWCTAAYVSFCLMSLYSDYELLVQTSGKSLPTLVYVNLAWNSFYMLYGVAIVWVASRTRNEASQTTALVHKIINANDANTDPVLTDEVDQHRPVSSVSSCGVYLFGFWNAPEKLNSLHAQFLLIGACTLLLFGNFFFFYIYLPSSACSRCNSSTEFQSSPVVCLISTGVSTTR